ncbi:MAG: hypothetical protein L0387_14695 [Acidobacteria bacterium]|nr:hypothetical protein [Acidobacteriota bacterium]MCI0622879.1 hypothetical protein [Acidobacteriota bacterium]
MPLISCFLNRVRKSPKLFALLAAFLTLAAAAFGCGMLVQGATSLAGLEQAIGQLGSSVLREEAALGAAGAFGVLGLGLLYGLRHATEVDHIVAVSTIVSEHRKLSQAAWVGGLWGAGHTLSLAIVGSIVLAMRVVIPERLASFFELSVALMIIGLGLSATAKAFGRRGDFHLHEHTHDNVAHIHVHFHEPDTRHAGPVKSHSHAIRQVGLKPVLVGAVHGLAGSAALTLLVLTQIRSVALGLLYLGTFGLGSVAGMLLMSGFVGLPFVWSARRVTRVHYGLQMAAGALSVCFGLWYAYEIYTANSDLLSFLSA